MSGVPAGLRAQVRSGNQRPRLDPALIPRKEWVFGIYLPDLLIRKFNLLFRLRVLQSHILSIWIQPLRVFGIRDENVYP